MVKHKFLRRFKAAIVGAAMIATSVSVPVVNYSTTIVSAAGVQEVADLPLTLIADGKKDGPRQANVLLTGDLRRAETLVIKLSSEVDANIGVYGFGIAKDPYWVDCDFSEDISSGSSTIRVDVPKDAQGRATKVGIGVWYPKDGSEVTIQSITADGLVDPIEGVSTGETSVPTTENDKSGTCTFKDNGDGTATIVATLSAQYSEDGETEFDIPLTQGWDEEKNYAPFKDPATGEPLPVWKEGDPINSHKFKFTGFGIDDLENIDFQSFEYVVTCDDYNMDNFQYGGGISVDMGSPADTEYAIGKDGYWYNDHGEDELEKYASAFQISDVHGPYKAEYVGNYAKLTWDVPKSVQPHIDYSNSFNSVGFQYWWGTDSSKPSQDEDGNELDYTVIPEVTLKSCIATYTRTMTVPYNETVKGTGSTISAKGSQKFDISSLNLGKRDKLSAIKFHVNSSAELQKFIGGFGISVTEDAQSTFIESEGWYQPGNVCVINNGPEFDVMIMLPDNIRNGVWGGKGANAQLGFYYGDKEGGDTISSVSVPSVEYYIFRTQEDDLKLTDKDGLEIPDKITLRVGDEYQVNANVKNCDYTSSRPNVASVDNSGLIKALEEGLTVVTVKTPEGQEKSIQVTVDPVLTDDDIDWDKVIWGDVDVNGLVELADVTALSKYLLSDKAFPLKNATAKENAQCKYDGVIDIIDLSKLIEYNLRTISMDDLGPQDPEIRKKATWYQRNKK